MCKWYVIGPYIGALLPIRYRCPFGSDDSKIQISRFMHVNKHVPGLRRGVFARENLAKIKTTNAQRRYCEWAQNLLIKPRNILMYYLWPDEKQCLSNDTPEHDLSTLIHPPCGRQFVQRVLIAIWIRGVYTIICDWHFALNMHFYFCL